MVHWGFLTRFGQVDLMGNRPATCTCTCTYTPSLAQATKNYCTENPTSKGV